MSGAIPPLPQNAFMAWCLVKKKHGDNFTLFVNKSMKGSMKMRSLYITICTFFCIHCQKAAVNPT